MKKGRYVKRYISILLMALLAISLTSCVAETNLTQEDDSFIIEEISLTEDEKNILALYGIENSNKLFHYNVDENVKSVYLRVYFLDEQLNWKEEYSLSKALEDNEGRILISNKENQVYRIAIQSKNSTSAFPTSPENDNEGTYKVSTISWADKTTINNEEEIPLAIQISTNENPVRTYGVASFFDTDRLKEHDKVMAIAVTFSNEVLK